MQKVLHLIDPAGLYGAEMVILNLSRELQGSPLRPVVGAIAPAGGQEPEIIAAARDLGLATAVFKGRSHFDPRLVGAVRRYLKHESVSILHSHGYKTSIIGWLSARKPDVALVITCHLWFAPRKAKLRFYHRLETLVMKRADAVVGVSEGISEELRGKGVSSRRVHTIYNGIDPTHYRPVPPSQTDESLSRIGIKPQDLVVGAVGRLHRQKDLPTLLEALARVRRAGVAVKGLIVGDGPDRDMLKRMAVEVGLGDDVSFTGYREDVLNLMKRLDIFALPSLMEGLPIVLLEAMASRSAVVATPVGAVPAVVQDGAHALLFPGGDASALAEHITRLARDPELRCRLGDAAGKRFEEAFSSRVMAKQYTALYARVSRSRFG